SQKNAAVVLPRIEAQMRAEPLGDQAVMTYWNAEAAAFAFAAGVRAASFPWLLDVVQAYQSVAVFFDAQRTDFFQVVERLRAEADSWTARARQSAARIHFIPCCYELGPDLERVASATRLSSDEVIAAHLGARYTVYAIGFSPGFPYLGYLPAELTGV